MLSRVSLLLPAVLLLTGCGEGNPQQSQQPEPLVAVISAAPTEGDAPLTVTADGLLSTGDPVIYEWDEDYDGTTFDVNASNATGAPINFNYAGFGIYTLALRVADAEATTDIAVVTVSVNTPGNIMPVADLLPVSSSGASPLTVDFDASGSADSDGFITWYLWDFDYNGATFTEDLRTPGALLTHVFYFPGNFTVAVKVLDDAGGWDIATVSVDVTDSIVTFPDAVLEQAVRDAIDKQTGSIYASDLEPVTTLNAAGPTDPLDPAPRISDLTNIQYLNNLAWLYLAHNTIADISPLTGLSKLQWLYIYDNSVADLTPLSGLLRLKGILAGDNGISSVAAVSALPLLRDLNVSNNSITDISSLAALPSILSLTVSDNTLSGGALPALPATLERFVASNCGLSDVSAVSALADVEWLELSLNSIGDASSVSSLTTLEFLSLYGCALTAVPDLSSLASLLEINLAGNPLVADWTPLGQATWLRWVNIAACNINDVTFLQNLTELRSIYLDANSIGSLAPIAGATNLMVLSASNNSIVDLAPLQDLLNLDYINLDTNSVVEITALVTNSNNSGLGQGDAVVLSNNPLSANAVNNDIPALEANDVLVVYP